jgi:hypothetical protein
MDKFTKYALSVMAIIVVVMLTSAYVGNMVGGNVATDSKVNNAASGNSTTTYYNPFTIEHWGVNGEYVGFFAAGCVGGFIVGYIFPTVFKSNLISRRKNQ